MTCSGMRHRFGAILLALFVVMGSTAAKAQGAISAVPSTEGIAKQDGLASENRPYLLGRGDTVAVSVEGRPELTGRQIVGPDGSITVPLAGSVRVAGKTRDAAARLITDKLLAYYTHPVVTVGVEQYSSNRILLLGAVGQPGVQLFDRAPTLLEALVRGGAAPRTGPTLEPRSPGAFAGPVFANALPDRCVVYRGTETAIQVDLKQVMSGSSSAANLRLERDDIVYVPAAADRYVSVLGQVQRPGSLPLEHETTLVRLLADAGGLTQLAGNNPTVHIVETSTGKSRDVAFNSLLKPFSSEVPLHSGDIVFVPESGFNRTAYAIERLSPLVSIFTTASLLTQK